MATKINIKRKVMDTSVTKLTCEFRAPNYRNHKGDDLIPKSTAETPAVLAYDDGEVIYTNNVKSVNDSVSTAGMGTTVAIRHDNGLITRYQHLKYGSIVVKVGERVRLGQKIATYGRPTNGNSDGPHLHFDISSPVTLGEDYIKSGFMGMTRYYINPLPYLERKTFVVRSAVNIRSGPGTNYKILGELEEKYEGIIYGRSGKWLRISPSESRWIHSNLVKEK
jgi:murein DD-endopeptidase MepM/ murein hydrolase activator NlpD